jgi:hypothetical protein
MTTKEGNESKRKVEKWKSPQFLIQQIDLCDQKIVCFSGFQTFYRLNKETPSGPTLLQ